VECATCRSGCARLDTYDEEAREILSRKYAQLWAINERTAKRYIDELATKYRPGTMIADVPSSRLRLLNGDRSATPGGAGRLDVSRFVQRVGRLNASGVMSAMSRP
jgi:hypothetical protein